MPHISPSNPLFHLLAQADVSVEETLLLTHFISLLALGFAVLVMGRVFFEHDKPSNVFAWMLLIIFVPYLGVPLYLIFGGRKNKRLIKNKREVLKLASEAIGNSGDSCALFQAGGTFEDNAFELLGDGVSSYHALCDEIRSAERHIHITIYILTDDDAGRAITELLCDRARDGVKVRVLIDALGSFGLKGRLLKKLRLAGAETERFMPVLPFHRRTSANLRNHRKIAIFDNNKAWLGGQNFDRRFLSEKPAPTLFKDYANLIKGPAVTALNRLFISDWCYAAHQDPKQFKSTLSTLVKPSGVNCMEVIPSGPDVSKDRLWERIILMIQEFKETITIVTPYFIPDEVIFQSLIVKASAGYSVRIILPHRSNHPIVDFARGYYLRRLSDAGAEILLSKDEMIHGKLIIADNDTALTGSANLDMRSLFLNFEIGLLHYSPNPVNQLDQWAESLLPGCVEFKSLEAPKPSRRILEDFVRLLVPLL